MKKNNGITLITLIVTVIIMIILAAVSIRIITSGGIIDKTRKAAVDTIYEADKEEFLLACAGTNDIWDLEIKKNALKEILSDWTVEISEDVKIKCTSKNNNVFNIAVDEIAKEITKINEIFSKSGMKSFFKENNVDFTRLIEDSDYTEALGFYELGTEFMQILAENNMQLIGAGLFGTKEAPEKLNNVLIECFDSEKVYIINLEKGTVEPVDEEESKKVVDFNFYIKENAEGEYVAVLNGYNAKVCVKYEEGTENEYTTKLKSLRQVIDKEMNDKSVTEEVALKNLVEAGKIDFDEYIETFVKGSCYEKRLWDLQYASYNSLMLAVKYGEANDEAKRVQHPLGIDDTITAYTKIFSKLLLEDLPAGQDFSDFVKILSEPIYDIEDVPNTIMGYKVEEITYDMFEYLSGVRKIVLPASIKDTNNYDGEKTNTFNKGITSLEQIVFEGKTDISEMKDFRIDGEYTTEVKDGNLIINIKK